MRQLAPVALFFVVACGGAAASQPEPTADDPPVAAPAAPSEADKASTCDDALTSAQDANEAAWEAIVAKGAPRTLEDLAAAACQRFCGRSTECAIEEACTELSSAEVAKLELGKTAPENTRQCLEQCNNARMTKAQIQTLGNCAQADDDDCATFRQCTASAQPR